MILIIENAATAGFGPFKEFASTILGALVALLAIWFKGREDARNERRKNAELIKATRLSIYSNLKRVSKTAWGHIEYVQDKDVPKTIWMPIIRELLPSSSTMKAIVSLSPREVYAVTAFSYFYQENLGYILGNSVKTVGSADAGFTTIRYDFGQEDPKFWLMMALLVIEDKCSWALDQVEKEIRRLYVDEPEWLKMANDSPATPERRATKESLWRQYHPTSKKAERLKKEPEATAD